MVAMLVKRWGPKCAQPARAKPATEERGKARGAGGGGEWRRRRWYTLDWVISLSSSSPGTREDIISHPPGNHQSQARGRRRRWGR
eukprot:4160636-Pyramimonas_sp.AAC.1